MIKFAIVFCSLFSTSVLAAPMPATSSSEFIKSQQNVFRSPHGFSLHSGQSNWIHNTGTIKNPFVVTSYRSPEPSTGVQAALTVRIDNLEKPTSLKKYVNHWMRDFPRLGFSVLSAKPVKIEGQLAFVVDMTNKNATRQLRQVLFLKDEKAVILTCRDQKESFQTSVKACNEIVRQFRWL